MSAEIELPQYLIDVVARETFERERIEAKPWDDLDEISKQGFRETAKMILMARAVQSDIKR